MMNSVAERVSQVMTEFTKEIPAKLNIVGILREAHERLTRITADANALPPQLIADKVAEVLREIATHAVEEFTRRTGQPFLWVDDPEPDEPEQLMSFGINVKDGKGTVTF